MKKFSNLSNNNRLYFSEIAAHMVANPMFYDFLNYEKNRYTITTEFENMFIYDIRNYNIKIDKTPIFPIDIENEWDMLKDTFSVMNILREKITYNEIVVREDYIMFDTTIYKKFDSVIEYDILNIHENINIISKLDIFINIIKQYIKPEYIEYLNTLKTNNHSSIGIRIETLPLLYYNNIIDYIKDVVSYKDAFRDYDLFKEIWYNTLHSVFNNNIINLLKQKDKTTLFEECMNIMNVGKINFYTINNGLKYYERFDIETQIPNIIIKIDSIKNLYIYMISDNFTFKIKIDYLLFPKKLSINIEGFDS